MTDLSLKVKNCVLIATPKRYSHSFAQITADSTKPDGLQRRFIAKAKGGGYTVPTFRLGDAVEFSNSKKGWYGFVIVQTTEALILRKAESGVMACELGEQLRNDAT